MLGLRRPRTALTPPPVRPERLAEARRAAQAAQERLKLERRRAALLDILLAHREEVKV